jgi:hypothetical protein
LTLCPNAWEQWLAGGYFRAYALHKDPRHLEAAGDLLIELEKQARRKIPEAVLTKRIRRLKGLVLIYRGNGRGREELLRLLADFGGPGAPVGSKQKELARFAADFSGSLSLIGEHDSAVMLIDRMAARQVEDLELVALRRSNHASWLNQRAVFYRAAGKPAKARADLDLAADGIQAALDIRRGLKSQIDHDQSLEMRECRAIELSIRIERSALKATDLQPEIEEMRALLNETPDFEAAVDTPLQLAYRVGRLGVAHMRTKASRSQRPQNFNRAQAYLRYAWEYSHNGPLRPWLALDLCEALSKAGQRSAAKAIANASLKRLVPQCGPSYPVNERLGKWLE